MKNKLKLTTALVGSLVAISAGSALAQQVTTYYDNGGKDGTTVSGNMNISYRDQHVSSQNTQGTTAGFHGFGKEVQLNINNRGKLNNGWGYAAGFSIEVDGSENSKSTTTTTAAANGGQTGFNASGIFGENNFIDLIIGDTTITLSADHIQNPDSNPTMMGAPSSYVAPYAANNGPLNVSSTLTATSNTTTPTSVRGLYPTSLGSPYENMGVGILQKTSVGSFSALYVPQRSSDGGSNNSYWGNDNGNTSTWADYGGGYGSAYEVGFLGGLTVPGLMTSAWYNHSDMSTSKGATVGSHGKMDGYKANATYAIGSSGFTVAAEYAVQDIPSYASVTTNAQYAGRVKGTSVGASYALTKDFTVAGTYAVSSIGNNSDGTAGNVANKADEKIRVFSAGYNLGAVAIKGQYRHTSNLGGLSTNGSEQDFLVWSGVNF
jgi:hypothetical protein